MAHRLDPSGWVLACGCCAFRIRPCKPRPNSHSGTNRGIDEIRELRDAARYRPARDKYKIILLDEAHQITDAAFNALLKTLEEPPDHIVFMMATTEPENIPQTIRSRCQHFSFHAVKLDDILSELRTIADKESIDADEGALALLAEAGDGSMRDALSIMDQAIASAPVIEGRPTLDATEIRNLMGSVPNTVFEQILEAVAENQTAEVLTIAARLLDAGNSPAQIARNFVRYLRNAVVAKIANLTPGNANSDLLQISPEERNRAARSAMLFTEEELTRFLQMMLRTFDELGYRQEQRFHLELGLLKLVHLQRLLPLEELLSAFPATPATPRPTPAPRPVASQPTRSSTPATSQRTLGSAPATPLSRPESERSADAAQRSASPPMVTPTIPTPEIITQNIATIVEPSRPLRSALEAGHSTEGALVVADLLDLAATADPESQPEQTPGTEADQLRNAVLEALFAIKNQISAAEKLEDADWTIANGELRIQTDMSPTLLKLAVNAGTEQLIKATLRAKDAAGLRLVLLTADPASRPTEKKERPAREGSVQSLAMNHPTVQQAQKLFNAEVTNVRDLRK